MALGRYAVSRRAAEFLEITLEGVLDSQTALSCEREVRALIAHAPPGLRARVNLSNVQEYQVEVRDRLVAMQRCIGAKAVRTAYVSESAPGRALALWVVHNAPDQVVRAFARESDATAWLGDFEMAKSGVREARSTRQTLGGRKRKAAAG